MLKLFLHLFVFLLFLYVVFGKYCVVDDDAPGISVLNGDSKDGAHWEKSSNYNQTDTVKDEISIETDGWKLMNSIDDGDLVNDLVLDERWETFLSNYYIKEFYHKLISRKTFFFSIGQTNGSSFQWTHCRVDQQKIDKCTSNHFKKHTSKNILSMHFDEYPEEIWKIHNNTYYFTTSQSSANISSKNNLELFFENLCVAFYSAMCETCKMDIEINKTKTLLQGNGKWKRVKLCDITSPSNPTITVTPIFNDDNKTSPFWAIGTEIYFSENFNLKCTRNKRFKRVPKDYECYNANSAKINLTEKVSYETCPTTTPAPPTTTTPTSTTTPKSKAVQKSGVLPIVLAVVAVVVVLIVISLLVYFFFFRKRNPYISVRYNKDKNEAKLKTNSQLSIDFSNNKNDTAVIKRSEFSTYVRRLLDPENSQMVKDQFDSLPKGYELYSYEDGVKKENSVKNQFPDVVPYDRNRIKLVQNLGDHYFTTDYINASYVHGFSYKKEYIVAQNPLSNTIVDFWSMVWQEKVEYIVMINGEDDNFEPYWPQSNKKAYGDIEITLIQEDFHEFYITRMFIVSRFGEERKVKQLHFHSWGVKDEVLSPHIFLKFVNDLLAIPHIESSPILFHCLGGIGRSASIVASDIALRAVAILGTINVHRIVTNLRKCRKSMVRNLKQYKLVHLIIMESLMYEQTAIQTNDDFRYNLSRYRDDDFAVAKFNEFLENKKWINEVITPYIQCNSYPKRNRYTHLLPVEHSRVKLRSKKNNYIHATFVRNYYQKLNYIVAQQPLQTTVSDFWLMVLENDVKTIINLHELEDTPNQLRNCLYFPTSNNAEIRFHHDRTVNLAHEDSYLHYDKISATIYFSEKGIEEVLIINVKNWKKTKITPNSTDVILAIWKAIQSSKNANQPIVICCDDGIRASGLVACFLYIIDKLLREQQCDVIGAVQAVRRSHLGFINLEQFEFLFKCVLAYKQQSSEQAF